MKNITIALALSLAGRAHKPVSFSRPDGQPISPAQLELDQTARKGEVQKAEMARTTEAAITLVGPSPYQTNFDGCMAQRGYVTQR